MVDREYVYLLYKRRPHEDVSQSPCHYIGYIKSDREYMYVVLPNMTD